MRRLILLLVAGCMPLAYSHADDMQFVLHNLHFTKFGAYGFQSPDVMHVVHQDRKGRLWMGTEGGLFLYDGHEVRAFTVDPAGNGTLPHGFVKAISEAPDGTVWLGTWGGGLAYFDEATRTIRVPEWHADPQVEQSFDPKIWSMDIDRHGRIWLGTFSSGLFLYDPSTGELRSMYQPTADEHPRANRIDTLFIDDNDRVWFAPVARRIKVIDVETLQPVDDFSDDVLLSPKARDSASDIGAFSDGRIFVLFNHLLRILTPQGELLNEWTVSTENKDGRLMEALAYENDSVLLGSGERLWYLDATSGESFPIPAGKWPGGMEASIVWDMDIGRDGDIFIASNTGLWINPSISRNFWTITESKPRSTSFVETRAIVRNDGSLFLNSENRIYELDFDGRVNRPRALSGHLHSDPPIGYPLWMEPAPDNCFWMGTDIGLVHTCSGDETRFVTEGSNAHALLFDEREQALLFDTGSGLKHVEYAQPTHALLNNPIDNPGSGSASSTVHLSFGEHDDVWAGTFDGIHRYDRTTHALINAFEEDAQTPGWNKPFTYFIKPAGDKSLFIGTSEGLFRGYLDKSGAIRSLEKRLTETAMENTSFPVALDTNSETPIFVTTFGFIKYDDKSDSADLLLFDDGVPNYQAYGGGFREYQDNIAILSGLLGPLIFNPSTLSFDHQSSSLVISDVLTFRDNELKAWPIRSGLKFQHEDRVIRFKFGLLDYIAPENNRYQIRLTGFSEEWLDIGRLGEFNFTDLDAGNYRLEVRATDGIFPADESVELDFEVLPPWWQTWWAYTLYAFIIFGSLFWYWLSLQRKIEREKEISARLREADRIKSHFLNELESKVEDATHDLRHAVEALEIKNIELDAAQRRALDASRLKSEFLANMSHEIRTPMNGVMGFTRLLQKSRLDDDQRDYVETIEKSANSLLGIINDVLDVSKIEAGKLIVDSVGFDLRQCISDTLEALAPVAYEKDLELIDHVDEDLPEGLRGDPARLRQMITNLIGNAIKFTDAGYVGVHVHRYIDSSERAWLQVVVQDTGRGISAEDRDRLFEAFEQGKVNLAGRYTGTGLGLVITKKLSEAMGGRIELESMPGEGTCVTLQLPLVADRNPENRYGFGRPLADRNVLLIDSHAQSRESLHARLAHWGANVTATAEPAAAAGMQADLVVVGMERDRLHKPEDFKALCGQLPADVPRLGLAAAVDHEKLRSLGEACNSPCLPKVGHLESQLRRIMGLLKISWQDAEQPAEPAAEQRLSGLKVLVADDNRINRYFLKKILELHGAEVAEADSGAAVLRMIDESSGARFDIALLDVHMPDMDGLEVARRIRAGGDLRLPLLAVSANIQTQTHEAAIEAGMNDYLLKPVEETKLVDAVLEWTGREIAVTSDESREE